MFFMNAWLDIEEIPERARNLPVKVIGGGLAGVEAAFKLAAEGVPVELYEMKPQRFSPAHGSINLAELVCSNSFKSNNELKACGLLKEELLELGSIVIKAALKARVPAGEVLAVDREVFSLKVTKAITSNPLIKVVRKEIVKIPKMGIVIIAAGPLPSWGLEKAIENLLGEEGLYFYGAIPPIIERDTIDFSKVFKASRYEEGEGDYINCPMSKKEYFDFVNALRNADKVPIKPFDDPTFLSESPPVDLLAEQGEHALVFGVMSPVGFTQFRGLKRGPFAVVQLRQDSLAGDYYSMVGFQTRLKMAEQDRVFRMIPGLKNARFLRYGTFHRNTYINAPKHLNCFLRLKSNPRIFYCGQICGVEGYCESAATGIMAGIFSAKLWKKESIQALPPESAIASLIRYITYGGHKEFRPMNISFGLFDTEHMLNIKNKGLRRRLIVDSALKKLDGWMKGMGIIDRKEFLTFR